MVVEKLIEVHSLAPLAGAQWSLSRRHAVEAGDAMEVGLQGSKYNEREFIIVDDRRVAAHMTRLPAE